VRRLAWSFTVAGRSFSRRPEKETVPVMRAFDGVVLDIQVTRRLFTSGLRAPSRATRKTATDPPTPFAPAGVVVPADPDDVDPERAGVDAPRAGAAADPAAGWVAPVPEAPGAGVGVGVGWVLPPTATASQSKRIDVDAPW
jgi:hypothetical protein